jgi:hypothetical protein
LKSFILRSDAKHRVTKDGPQAEVFQQPARVIFCRAFCPKTGLILSLSKDPLFGNALKRPEGAVPGLAYSIGR